MAGMKIIGASHPGRFSREFTGGGVDGQERYLAEFSVDGGRCRLVHDYRTGEVFIWFESKAAVGIMRRVLSLTDYLGRALFVGTLPGRGMRGEAFVKLPGGRLEVRRTGEGLWLGWDGSNWIFSANVQGIAELIDLMGDGP